MLAALDVARFLIHLAVSGDEPDALSHLRLQKLLYYVQGWHLGNHGRPMFDGRIEAWRNGPVVTEIWTAFKKYGNSSILPEQNDEPSNLNSKDQAFIRSIWDQYKMYSAIRLSGMTHGEPPWKKARNGIPSYEQSSEEITHDSMRTYFGKLLAARMPPGINLSQLIKAEEDIKSGRFKTHQELRSRLAEKGNGV